MKERVDYLAGAERMVQLLARGQSHDEQQTAASTRRRQPLVEGGGDALQLPSRVAATTWTWSFILATDGLLRAALWAGRICMRWAVIDACTLSVSVIEATHEHFSRHPNHETVGMRVKPM